MKRSYRVTADVKENRHEYAFVVDVIARNKKEAIQTAIQKWEKVRQNHLFHINARRLEDLKEAFYYARWTKTGQNW